MKRYIVLSVNDNPDYLYYLPLCVWAWRKIDWTPVLFFTHTDSKQFHELSELIDKTFDKYHEGMTPQMYNLYRLKVLHGTSNIEGYRSDTITQVSRLYAACILPSDSMIMTGDIDMIPLSDYWQPDPKLITVYGHDLTGYSEYPICYLAMTRERWAEVMGLSNEHYPELIERDLDLMPNAKSTDFNKYWSTDQQLITERIKAVNFDKGFVNRGQYPNGYAKGRIDRGSWSLDHSEYIDAHLHRDLYKAWQPNPSDLYLLKWAQHMQLLNKIWPNEDWTWLIEYSKRFAKLC